MRSKFSASTRCLAAICDDASRCCNEQPLHWAKCWHSGSTRCGEAVITSTTSASSKCRWRLRSFAITVSPSRPPLTKTVLPLIRATPRPSWPRSVMWASNGFGETKLDRDMGTAGGGWPPIITDRPVSRPATPRPGGVLVVPAGASLLDPALGEGGANLRLPLRMVVGHGDFAIQRGAIAVLVGHRG